MDTVRHELVAVRDGSLGGISGSDMVSNDGEASQQE